MPLQSLISLVCKSAGNYFVIRSLAILVSRFQQDAFRLHSCHCAARRPCIF